MNEAGFKVSLTRVATLLKQIGLLRQKGIKSINDVGVSAEFKSASQKQNYFETYKVALKNFDYDFLLKDESFFQFEFKPNTEFDGFPDIRYAFYQNPQEFKTYPEYIRYLIENEFIGKEDAEEDIGDIFQEDYEQFLVEQQLDLKSLSIRFDADIKNYRPLIHSVAHIHIGHNNDIRIPCDKILTPENFVLFVLKHTHYYFWLESVENGDKIILDSLMASKGSCYNLENKFWNTEEKRELFIT